MVLHEHQQKMEDELFNAIKKYKSILAQSATGSGKTVIMCSFINKYMQLHPDAIILVSVHREELVQQTCLTLAQFGIMSQAITSKSKNQPGFTNVYVGMTQTIHARQIEFDSNEMLMVIDEAHEQVHVKTFHLFPNAIRVGFTATPIINQYTIYYKCNYCEEKFDFQDVCCYNEQIEKWKKPVTMSEQYEEIILGPPIRWLIDNGFLVDEVVTSFNYYSEVKDIDNEEEVVAESVKHDENVLAEYLEKAKGKKTMIFTAFTKQNKTLVELFENNGLNVRSYDSVNNDKKDRFDVVKWFRETDGAILISTGTFTTGFDVREVECIMLNRPTKSLSLYHQIVGRGARTSNLIFKDYFLFIDLGGNKDRFGKWSDDIDWRDIFFNGLKKERKKKQVLIQCDKCFYNWIGVEGDTCPDCGHTNVNQNPSKRGEREEKEIEILKSRTVIDKEIPLPNPAKIADFVKRTSNEKKDFFKIIIERYVDLWKLNRVSKTLYNQRVENGSLSIKIEIYVERMYNHHKSITVGKFRTKNYIIESIKTRLESIYQ